MSGTAYRTRREEHAARWLGLPAPLRRSRGAGTPPSSPTATACGALPTRMATHRARREPRLPLAAVVCRWAGCGAALPGRAGSCSRGTAARRCPAPPGGSRYCRRVPGEGEPWGPGDAAPGARCRGAGDGSAPPSAWGTPRETERPPPPACWALLAKAARWVCQHLPGAARRGPGGVPGEHRKLSRP